MRILVATDAHIFKSPDGKYWCKSIYGYNFWQRYLNVFDDVKIVARTKEIKDITSNLIRVDGEHVDVFGIPFYQGPKQLIFKYFQIHQCLKDVFRDCDVALFRMPSQTAYMTYQHLPVGMPFAGEIVYDLTDDLKNKDNTFIVRFLNKITSKRLAKFCMAANGVSYVTENTIQKNYPSRARINGESINYFETYYSTITLQANAFTLPRNYDNKKELILVLSDVAMNSERKGERTLLEAMKTCINQGFNIRAIIIGDGSKKKSFMDLATQFKIKDRVEFTGLLPTSDDVRKKLLEADVFVFPTKAEGLPRGILEAMAVGLPVISSPVGGIPEIIDEEYLLDPRDYKGYADMLCHLLNNTDELNAMSKKNFYKASQFKNDLLQKKRDLFYNKLRKLVLKRNYK